MTGWLVVFLDKDGAMHLMSRTPLDKKPSAGDCQAWGRWHAYTAYMYVRLPSESFLVTGVAA